MVDVDEALWKLGIPSKTRHNEVAPGQFEIAPIFESQNLAVDHNMLVMEVLRKPPISTTWSACSMKSPSRE